MATIPFLRPLGRTGLQVSCVGMGGGTGISSADVLYAFDRGVNCFFFSSDLHHFLYGRMAAALRALCGAGSARRSEVVLVAATYTKEPGLLESVLFDQFAELGIDYIDVFLWGWVDSTDQTRIPHLLANVPRLRGPGAELSRYIEQVFGLSEHMRRAGVVRNVGMSVHDTSLAAELASQPELDVVMTRSNFAHRSALGRVFEPLAPVPARPGIVSFNSTRGDVGPLWRPPFDLPAECRRPTPADCYRYVLSLPSVDVCLTGPRNRSEVDALLAAVELGTLSDGERRYLETYGDVYRGRQPINALASGPSSDAMPVSLC